MTLDEAIKYVGGGSLEEWTLASEIHFELLQEFGLTPDKSILEIGAGCLGLARRLTEYLDSDGYTGIEPNRDVSESAPPLAPDRHPVLLDCKDFDPSASRRTFDIVFAHSVLTHAARWQLELFLRNVRPYLRPEGFILASLRFGEDTDADQWTYPKAVWFSVETLQKVAAREGFVLETRKNIRITCEARLRRMFHDWVLFHPTTTML